MMLKSCIFLLAAITALYVVDAKKEITHDVLWNSEKEALLKALTEELGTALKNGMVLASQGLQTVETAIRNAPPKFDHKRPKVQIHDFYEKFRTSPEETTSSYASTFEEVDRIAHAYQPTQDHITEDSDSFIAQSSIEDEESTDSSEGGLSWVPDEHSIDDVDPRKPAPFPKFTDIPETSFTCSDKQYLPGFYADIESDCQVFHVCLPDRRESFLCPVGTTFNQALRVCDYWYKTNCSLTPFYYDTNAETSFDSLEIKTEDTGSMVSELLHAEDETSSTHTDFSKEFTSNEEMMSYISQFLPIKAKVVAYPETSDKRAKIIASTSIGKESSRSVFKSAPQTNGAEKDDLGLDQSMNLQYSVKQPHVPEQSKDKQKEVAVEAAWKRFLSTLKSVWKDLIHELETIDKRHSGHKPCQCVSETPGLFPEKPKCPHHPRHTTTHKPPITEPPYVPEHHTTTEYPHFTEDSYLPGHHTTEHPHVPEDPYEPEHHTEEPYVPDHHTTEYVTEEPYVPEYHTTRRPSVTRKPSLPKPKTSTPRPAVTKKPYEPGHKTSTPRPPVTHKPYEPKHKITTRRPPYTQKPFIPKHTTQSPPVTHKPYVPKHTVPTHPSPITHKPYVPPRIVKPIVKGKVLPSLPALNPKFIVTPVVVPRKSKPVPSERLVKPHRVSFDTKKALTNYYLRLLKANFKG